VAIDHIDNGVVQDSFGSVAFHVRYTAVILKPHKNETLDALIMTVNKMGFFANVGPLQIFVSNHLIPGEFRFEPNSVPPCYLSEEQNAKIAPGDMVRLRIVGTRIDATEMFAIGTIKDDYLGILS
jgi:DNA-directed RNA polymerase II subunit RPB7